MLSSLSHGGEKLNVGLDILQTREKSAPTFEVGVFYHLYECHPHTQMNMHTSHTYSSLTHVNTLHTQTHTHTETEIERENTFSIFSLF